MFLVTYQVGEQEMLRLVCQSLCCSLTHSLEVDEDSGQKLRVIAAMDSCACFKHDFMHM